MEPSQSATVTLPLAAIRPSPNQPRSYFDPASLTELAATIDELGQLDPIQVRPDPEGDGYLIIAGERRYRALTQLGRLTVEAIVRDVDEQTAYRISLVENMQRENLSPFEEAAGLQRLIDDYGLTQQEAAREVGKEANTVPGILGLNKLPAKIRREYERLTDRPAKSILIELATAEKAQQQALWKEIRAGNIRTVRDFREKRRERPERDELAAILAAGRRFVGSLERTPRELVAEDEARLAEVRQLSERLAAWVAAVGEGIAEPPTAARQRPKRSYPRTTRRQGSARSAASCAGYRTPQASDRRLRSSRPRVSRARLYRTPRPPAGGPVSDMLARDGRCRLRQPAAATIAPTMSRAS